MVLVSCPECKKQISNKAVTCPYCGVGKGKSTEQVTGKDAVILLLSFVLGVFLAAFTMDLVEEDKEGLKLGIGLVALATPPSCVLWWSNRRKV